MNTTVSYPRDRQYIALCTWLAVFRLPTFVVCRVYFLSKFVRYLPRLGIVALLRLGFICLGYKLLRAKDSCFFLCIKCVFRLMEHLFYKKIHKETFVCSLQYTPININ